MAGMGVWTNTARHNGVSYIALFVHGFHHRSCGAAILRERANQLPSDDAVRIRVAVEVDFINVHRMHGRGLCGQRRSQGNASKECLR